MRQRSPASILFRMVATASFSEFMSEWVQESTGTHLSAYWKINGSLLNKVRSLCITVRESNCVFTPIIPCAMVLLIMGCSSPSNPKMRTISLLAFPDIVQEHETNRLKSYKFSSTKSKQNLRSFDAFSALRCVEFLHQHN